MQAAGFEPEDYANDIVEVWPENRRAFEFFRRIGTRWMVGMNGVTGLRWEAIYPLLDRMNLTETEWNSLRDDLEVMESAALPVINRRD